MEENKFIAMKNQREDKIPHDKNNDYKKDFVSQRTDWLEKKTGTKLFHMRQSSQDFQNFKGNVENLVGIAQIPIGITGPLKILGEHAIGDFYIPFATTEGAMVTTYNIGMRILTKSGGVTATIFRDNVHLDPIFMVKNLKEAKQFCEWVEGNFEKIKREAESTTKHGQLKSIESFIMGRRVVLKFNYYTADAHGLNMINVATEKACKLINRETAKQFFIRSNFSSIKKFSTQNMAIGLGKAVFAEAVVPKTILKMLKVTPEEMVEQFINCYLISSHVGMMGVNAQVSNCIAAIFLACGQDIADLSTSQTAFSMCEITEDGDLYTSIYLPNLLVGTVGGGTNLGTQRECLDILGCYGTGKVNKFAEIVAAAALAGELVTTAAIANGTFVDAHATLGRNKPQD